MIKSSFALSGALLLLASTASAQVAAPVQPAPAAAVLTPVADSTILRSGTQIALRMSEGLTTEGRQLRVGHRFNLEVAEDVMLNGRIVIPVGSPAVGEVTDVRNKGMWGRSGRINARVLSLRANGRQIRLTGQVDDRGVTGTAGVVASVALVPVVGFFVTGTSARIPLGAPVNAFLDEDVSVAFADAAPQPIVVAPAPVAAAQTTPN
jgi:hypothetical protein